VAAFSSAVATATAERWHGALERAGDKEAMLWRLLRMGSAPYFVLGTSPRRSLRLRIATPWDWRQSYRLLNFEVAAKPGGQPLVAWRAEVRHVHDASVATIEGHIEVRWSHGRFGGPPEAKAYLDTPTNSCRATSPSPERSGAARRGPRPARQSRWCAASVHSPQPSSRVLPWSRSPS